MREISDESATDTLTNTDRGYLNAEYSQLSSEVDRIVSVTEFNGTQMLNGAWTGKDLQIGSNNSVNDRLTTTISSMSTTSLGLSSANIADKANAQSSLDLLDAAIDSVNNARSNIGAYVNRLENTITNLENAELNTQSAESTIRDVDVGEEMSNFTKLQILSQAGTSMLSQANSVPQTVMSLFQ
jgi:flagellin